MTEGFYQRLFSFTATPEELAEFCYHIDDNDYDTDNSFAKYYNVELIYLAMQKYQDGEIDANYLADWCNAYNWILFASEWGIYEDGQDINYSNIQDNFIDYIKNEISETLDSLSFFDEHDKKYYNFKKYKNWFAKYDKFYNEAKDLDITEYTVIDRVDDEYPVYVTINHDKKEFAIISDLEKGEEATDDKNNAAVLPKIIAQIQDLKTKGYKEYK